MKLLWLCNMIPGPVQKAISGQEGNGLWVDQVLCGLMNQPDIQVHVLCPAVREQEGSAGENCTYHTFVMGKPEVYVPEHRELFLRQLDTFQPDVIHIWGTEFGHTLAMVNALQQRKLLSHAIIHIQGLCSEIAGCYCQGLPMDVVMNSSFRDLVRQDNVYQQQKKFALRGENEILALKKISHVMGRTHWDRSCVEKNNPHALYHVCNETLRASFYEGQWCYDTCRKHRIFATSCMYPIKGFHYMLEAFAQIVKKYPDARLAVPGKSYMAHTPKEKLKQTKYQQYLQKLTREYGLTDRIEFLGSLNAEQMKSEFLRCHAFVLPSAIENSPNTLGEAMLLGVPCVAADVGGVSSMLADGEGYLYGSGQTESMVQALEEIFRQGDSVEAMGEAARAHALKTHDPQKNLQDLLSIYKTICK